MTAAKAPRALGRPATQAGSSTRSGTGPSDTALVVAARAGEAWAQQAIYERYARMVNSLAWRLMPGDAEVEDLVQDAFVQALDHLQRLKEPAALSSWLGSIVIRQAHKRLRRKRLRIKLGLLRSEPIDPETVVDTGAPLEAAAELRAVYSVLQELPAEERIALVLRRVEGLELNEIAERMGLSLATVKRRVVAAEKVLARVFAAPGTDEPGGGP